MEPLSLVIPTFNEAEAIASVIDEIPVAHRLDFIIAEAAALTGHRGSPARRVRELLLRAYLRPGLRPGRSHIPPAI